MQQCSAPHFLFFFSRKKIFYFSSFFTRSSCLLSAHHSKIMSRLRTAEYERDIFNLGIPFPRILIRAIHLIHPLFESHHASGGGTSGGSKKGLWYYPTASYFVEDFNGALFQPLSPAPITLQPPCQTQANEYDNTSCNSGYKNILISQTFEGKENIDTNIPTSITRKLTWLNGDFF